MLLQVSAPSNHVRDRILTRYLPLVRDALDEIGRRRACELEIVVDEREPDEEPADATTTAARRLADAAIERRSLEHRTATRHGAARRRPG